MGDLAEGLKSFWDERPCNSRHSRKIVGSDAYFYEVAKRRYTVEPHIPAFAEFEKWSGKRVLEVGCGIGTDAVSFALAGAQVTAVDVSEKSLDLAGANACAHNMWDVEFLCADAEQDLPLPANHFDLLYSFGVLHHTPHPVQALRNAVRCLKPGGEARVMLYARDSWKSAMIEARLDQPEAQAGCPLARQYTRTAAEVLLIDAGLEPVSVEQDHIFPYNVEAYAEGRLVKQPWFEAMPSEVYGALRRRFGWHLLLRARKAA